MRKYAEKKKLNKQLVRQTLRGYARANKFIEAEKRAWLSRLTPKESWELFDDLYRSWKQMRKKSSDGWKTLEQRRLEEKVALRRTLDRAAKKIQQASVASP